MWVTPTPHWLPGSQERPGIERSQQERTPPSSRVEEDGGWGGKTEATLRAERKLGTRWRCPSESAQSRCRRGGLTQGFGVWGGLLDLQSFPDLWEECFIENL